MYVLCLYIDLHKVSPIVCIPSEQVMDFWFVLSDRPRMPLDGVNHNDIGEIILRVVYLNWRQVKEGVSVGMKHHISTDIKPTFQTTFNGRYLSCRSIFCLSFLLLNKNTNITVWQCHGPASQKEMSETFCARKVQIAHILWSLTHLTIVR